MADLARTLARGVGELLITLGVVILLFCVYELKVTGLYTDREQSSLGRELDRAWAAQPSPAALPTPGAGRTPAPGRTPGPGAGPSPTGPGAPGAGGQPAPDAVPVSVRQVPKGGAFAVLHVPRLGRDWSRVLVEGVSVEDLKRGPGHYPGTALPGEVGNVVLSGHRTTYGSPFADLDRLRPGDAIVLQTRDSWFTYRMTGARIVPPSAIEVTYPVPGQRGARPTQRLLTLTTCHPEYSARERLVVSARLEQALRKAPGLVPPALRRT